MKSDTRSRREFLKIAAAVQDAAGPAVLTNTSYVEQSPIGWDPERMRPAPGTAKPGRTGAGREER